jgi:hypothetical protein
VALPIQDLVQQLDMPVSLALSVALFKGGIKSIGYSFALVA